MNTKELLEQEIKASNEYTRENFGQVVGDGYPELVKEVVTSPEVQINLLLGLCLGAMSAKELSKSLNMNDDKKAMETSILKNIHAFQDSLSMLYWGINIGRKLQQEENKVLSRLEDANGTN